MDDEYDKIMYDFYVLLGDLAMSLKLNYYLLKIFDISPKKICKKYKIFS